MSSICIKYISAAHPMPSDLCFGASSQFQTIQLRNFFPSHKNQVASGDVFNFLFRKPSEHRVISKLAATWIVEAWYARTNKRENHLVSSIFQHCANLTLFSPSVQKGIWMSALYYLDMIASIYGIAGRHIASPLCKFHHNRLFNSPDHDWYRHCHGRYHQRHERYHQSHERMK